MGEEEKTDGMLTVYKIVYTTNHILLIRYCELHLSSSHDKLVTEERNCDFMQLSKYLVYERPDYHLITLAGKLKIVKKYVPVSEQYSIRSILYGILLDRPNFQHFEMHS